MDEPLRLSVQEPARKRRKGPVAFTVPGTLARADETMAGPCRGVLPRVAGKGGLVFRFALPLELCSPENRHSHGKAWMHARRKNQVFEFLWRQYPQIRAVPLRGRPQIRAVRFSVKEPDQLSDGFKTPIDMLCLPRPPRADGKGGKKGLGFLVDDAPRCVEIATWWEYAPPRAGFGLLEIWTGEEGNG